MNKERLLSLKISTFIVITSCVFIICAGLLTNLNFKKAIIFWGDNVQITAYLDKKLSESEKQTVLHQIQEMKDVQNAQLISPETALNEFTSQMASFAKEILTDKDLLNFIPSSINVSLISNLEPQKQLANMKTTQEKLKLISHIEEVYFGADYIERISTITSSISGVLYALTLILLAAGVLVFSNSIRASIFHRQEEIKIYELCGATPWDVRKPFIIEAGVMGAAASALSLVALFALFTFLIQKLQTQHLLLHIARQLEFFSTLMCLAIIICGSLLGVLAASTCLRAVNTGFAAKGVRAK